MLELRAIDCFYGRVQVLRGLSLDARAGEVLCLLGRNGAGKTTTLKAIMGLVPPRAGAIILNGEAISGLPAHQVPRRGVGYVPQGRRLFAELTVAENLEIGLMTRGKGAAVRDRVLDIFPHLRQRLRQQAGTLSGGEQQMLALARALCLEPSVLLRDGATEGLHTRMLAQLRGVTGARGETGVATLLVEQRVDAVLAIADRVAFIENGRNRRTVAAAELRDDPALVHAYVGVGSI